jgi:hypothetical protein
MKTLRTLILCICFALPAITASADGELTVKPYGFVLSNMQYNNNVKADIPTVCALTDTTKNLLMTARQTRFGLTLDMEEQGWNLGGKVELDFWGLRGSGKNGSSMQSAPRLRMAFLSLTKKKVTLVFGQDWVCFAPLSPESDAHVSIPAFSSSGNLWNRMPQIRLEYKNATEKHTTLAQLAVVRPLASDQDPTTSYSQADLLGAGELNGLPFVQGRFALSPSKQITVGLSGHYGQEDFQIALNDSAFKDKSTTYAGAIDFKAAGPVVSLMGEAYVGANLISLFSNASYFKDTWTSTTGVKNEPVKTQGGWAMVGIKPKHSKVLLNFGTGIEMLNEEHVDSVATHDATKAKLLKNFTVFGSLLYSPMSKVRFGVEVGSIKTTYHTYVTTPTAAIIEDSGDNLSANLSAKFSF